MASDADYANIKPKVKEGDLPTWESQVVQYPPKGPPGISYFRGRITGDYFVDCLLYRDDDGDLIGVLNHYPADYPPYEREGSVNMWVRPDRQGQGIGKALGLEAMSRWEPHPETLKYTEAGAKWVAAMERRFAGSPVDYRAEGWHAWRDSQPEAEDPPESR